MELSLHRQDIVQVGSNSARNTLRLLPSAKKKKQKIAVGDDTGSVSCFQVKRGDVQSVFKTMGLNEGKQINFLCLGGPSGQKDKIFISSGQRIVGLTKKGKEFFKFNSNLTETISNMFVEDAKTWTGGEYVYNLFENGRDVNFYMSHDRINALTVEYVTNEQEMDCILGCQDRYIRVISGNENVFEASVNGSVNALVSLRDKQTSEAARSGTKKIVYGTENGIVGEMLLEPSMVRPGWTVQQSGQEAGVNSIHTYDMTKDDVKDVLVGRDDGQIQVYSFDMGPDPILQFSANVNESVRSIEAGVVSSQDYEEVIVSTYSGKVISYTSERLTDRDADDSRGRAKHTVNNESRIAKIRQELDELRGKVAKEKEKLSRQVEEYIPVCQQFIVNTKFILDPEQAAYRVTVEIPLPIDVVLMQSAVPIDLLPVASNEAIVSRSPADPSNENVLLATYRCQDATNRLEMKVRTVEGQYGSLQLMVVAKMAPKTAQSIKLDIKPLSLHHRLHSLQDADDAGNPRALNHLHFTGPFTLLQMHEWVCLCLPNVPGRIQEDEVSFAFRNAFIGSVLLCKYRRGEASFSSDSVSTIAILKEVITKEATARKVEVRLNFEIDDETIPAFLKLVHPRLEHQLQLAQRVQLIEAVKEIQMQEDSTEWMSEEYKDLVDNADALQKEFENQPRALEFLSGIITDLYVDKHKFKGHNRSNRIPDLLKLLQNYNLDSVIDFFFEG